MRRPDVFTIQYSPTSKQKLFHSSSADEVLFGGAAGGGKSKAMQSAFLREEKAR